MFLKVAGSIEAQLRDAYARLHDDNLENQSSLAEKLGVNRSVVSRRLTGQTNMTIETLADMLWALRLDIKIDIFDPSTRGAENTSRGEGEVQTASPAPLSTTGHAMGNADMDTMK
jgi:hypothetical protein